MKVSIQGGNIEEMAGRESLSGFSITTRETRSSPPTRLGGWKMRGKWGVKEILCGGKDGSCRMWQEIGM